MATMIPIPHSPATTRFHAGSFVEAHLARDLESTRRDPAGTHPAERNAGGEAMHTESTCTVYGRDGEKRSWSTAFGQALPARSVSATSTIAADVSITEIMARRVVCAGRELPLDVLAHLMVHHHVGCVPIVNESGRPVGIVTKLDLVEHFDVNARRLPACEPVQTRPLTATDVMMPLAITLDERASVADAAAMFVSEDFHHIMIVSTTGALIGVVSTKDVVRWLAENDRAARAG